jgi:hypothetical protein
MPTLIGTAIAAFETGVAWRDAELEVLARLETAVRLPVPFRAELEREDHVGLQRRLAELPLSSTPSLNMISFTS